MALRNYLCPEGTQCIEEAVVEVLPLLVCSISSSMEGANGYIMITNHQKDYCWNGNKTLQINILRFNTIFYYYLPHLYYYPFDMV